MRERIDAEANEQGFYFLCQGEGYGKPFVYVNEDETLRRTYNSKTGELMHESVYKSGKSKKFLTPVENARVEERGVRWWGGKGNERKRTNRRKR